MSQRTHLKSGERDSEFKSQFRGKEVGCTLSLAELKIQNVPASGNLLICAGEPVQTSTAGSEPGQIYSVPEKDAPVADPFAPSPSC